MGIDTKSMTDAFFGCLTNFRYYRQLVQRPLKETFIYLAVLLALPTLLISGLQVYGLNKMMAEITAELKGNLPPLRIEKGEVIMEGGDTFRFEKEREFSPGDWEDFVSHYPGASPEIKEEAAEWVRRNFPEPDILLTPSGVEGLLAEFPAEQAETAQLLRETSNFGKIVFLVDLSGKEPVFTPGDWGYAVGKDSYYINIFGQSIPTKLTEETSTVINDGTLERWRRSLLWQRAPLMAFMLYLLNWVVTIFIILGGIILAALTASVLKKSIPFRKLFAIGVYGLTPAVLFFLVFMALSFLEITLGVGTSLLCSLFLYLVYVVGGTNKCCTLD